MAGDSHPSSTHPPLPPTTEDDRFHHLRLLRSRRVGATTYHRLLTEHGTVQNALAALPKVARAAGVASYEICPEPVIEAELRAAERAGARLLIYGHRGYPKALMEMPAPPPLLWVLGSPTLLLRPMVAMVGARNASALGTRMAKALAGALGERGYVVVSGLARGIDTAAHAAALETGTIAVQAGGVDTIYPVENTGLAEQISIQGLRLSDQPMGLQPTARHFPARNRIIAGLAQATVVVEAAAKSGSLITAREALDLGRDVMAVPGHPFDARASGCNLLLRDGAILVRNADDVADALAPLADPATATIETGTPAPPDVAPPPRSHPAPPPNLRALHSQILDRLGPVPMPEDDLIRDLAARSNQVSPALTDLELSGAIRRHSGGRVSRPA